MSDIKVIGVEIPNNQSISGSVDLGNLQICAIEMPTTWAGTKISFLSKSHREKGDNTQDNIEDWNDVYNDAGTEVSLTVAGNRIVGISAQVMMDALRGLRYIRIRSGVTGTPVNQSPAKVIRLICKE